MARHRSPGGQDTSLALDQALDKAQLRIRGAHRIPTPSSAARGKVVVAAVAAGAFAAATAGHSLGSDSPSDTHAGVTTLAHGDDATTANGVGGRSPAAASPRILHTTETADAATEAQKLAETTQVTAERKRREAEAARLAALPDVMAPTEGSFTSGFGSRWGTTHRGVDIANAVGTPIVAASDGRVIEAGPASGFGLWVRIQLNDGTVHVYGHINSYSVSEGERVRAGEQIATMGNRGHSTGPHLHFEVWEPGGQKVDPRAWLAERGADI